jgi:membrane protease YdiL (CAAX protease family)
MTAAVALMWVMGGITITTRPIGEVSRALALTVQSGVMEEIAFRLIVLRLVWRAFGLEVALFLSALLFGVAHIFNPNSAWFPSIAIAIEAGIMLAAFYILTGRIWMSIGVHAGWNFTQGWIYGAPVSGTSAFDGGPINVEPVRGVSDVVSGSGFGPEASIAGLLVGTAVGGYVFWMAWQRGRLRGADPA